MGQLKVHPATGSRFLSGGAATHPTLEKELSPLEKEVSPLLPPPSCLELAEGGC